MIWWKRSLIWWKVEDDLVEVLDDLVGAFVEMERFPCFRRSPLHYQLSLRTNIDATRNLFSMSTSGKPQKSLLVGIVGPDPYNLYKLGSDAKKIVDHGKALGFQLRSLIDVKCIWEQEMSTCL